MASLFPPMPEPVDELRPGVLATVRGLVAPRDVVPSPLTGEPCVYYYYTVEEWRRSGVVTGVEGSWHLIDRDEVSRVLPGRTAGACSSPVAGAHRPRRGIRPRGRHWHVDQRASSC
jgi:hypothetical protein